MKKHFIILTFLLLSISSFSQISNGNEIVAEGISKMKVKPNLASFRISISIKNATEKISIKELNEEVEKLQRLLLKVGFTKENIKIAEFKVSSSENNDDQKEYITENTLIVGFGLDNKIIEAFYQEIQNENLKNSEIEFKTQVSEELEKATRQKLVKLAIDDAKSNAENIANSLDVKLTNIKKVTKYNIRDFDNEPLMKISEVRFAKPIMAIGKNQKSSFDKFEVIEIELQETITIVYEITKK